MLTLSLFGGCATPALPPLTANNPASGDAPEAVTPPTRRVLAVDPAMKRTSQLIAARAQQESQGQAEQQPEKSMQKMPGMKHDQDSAERLFPRIRLAALWDSIKPTLR